MRKPTCIILTVAIVTWGVAWASAAEPHPGKDRGFSVQSINNDHPNFMVGVQVDRADRTYEDGEEMTVKVRSEKDGYLYLLYRAADGKITCLFPNRIQQENRIRKGEVVTVPAKDAQFRLRAGAPYGKEVLAALVLARPLTPQDCAVKSLTEKNATPLSEEGVKGMYLAAVKQPWAEHRVLITTVKKRDEPAVCRRILLSVGIDRYQDERIPRLSASRHDAGQIVSVMKDRCQVDDSIVLIDEQATRTKIEEAICTTLVERTRPGDLVFIYWSGHGFRVPDASAAHIDGYAKYLVPFDARLDSLASVNDTMIEARTFARWLQSLDGRKVVLILDACYAGGQGGGGERGLVDPTPNVPFDFLDEELLQVTKSIGRQQVAKLASSMGRQPSLVRLDGNVSVMTGFLIEFLSTGTDSVTLKDAYEYLKVKVPQYVRARFPGFEQTPVLIDNITPPVHLRPR